MWKEFLKAINEECEFNAPATNEQLEEISLKFNVELPEELVSLLKITNGFDESNGLCWSTKRILEVNLMMRTEENIIDNFMSFDSLLFVADAGNGNYFGYAVINGSVQYENIYAWNHEDDSRIWKASSLKEFIEGWSNGSIYV